MQRVALNDCVVVRCEDEQLLWNTLSNSARNAKGFTNLQLQPEAETLLRSHEREEQIHLRTDAMSWTSLCGFRKAMLPSPWTSSTHSSASSVKAPAFRLIFRLTTLNLIVECFQASRLSKLSTSRTGISTGNLSSTPLPCDHGQWTLRFGCR